MGGTRHLGEDFGMEPESKRHTMSHPPDNIADTKNNGKSGKANKNESKKVINLYFNIHYYVM